ncbi:YciI family protein [Rhodococcus tibetensis]|uniref:YciI family protein n=1 Tax=Rhodococcus tibetensis TaxID=2965064 RepID=A0ABT1QJY6_9NOCA|nr:YciI family protein [Rhodococcus sp. FXJ9.536]MCQ4122477.1 YciI family protein [Rhodococcus sp. FXJ9.536]
MAAEPCTPRLRRRRSASGTAYCFFTDGPFAETAEVANGLYVLAAENRQSAIALAAKVPVSPKGCIELRRIVDDTR